MHKLARQVRFSINPFLPSDALGFNSFASKPTGEGLSIFFELCVALEGKVEPATGFVVNVVDIDRNVRQYVVPIFARRVREEYKRGAHIKLSDIAGLLKSAKEKLSDKFGKAQLVELGLKLNPFRKMTLECKGAGEEGKMVHFSEKFEFAAMHRLWNSGISDEQNFKVFGKCANPNGHGHNYTIEVTVKMPTDKENFCIGDFEKIVDSELIEVVDHKNLNVDVPHFSKSIPTVENIAAFAWERIVGKFGEAKLHCVTVWETDKTYCSYYG